MNEQQQQVKIQWFVLRTGCTPEEAKVWLKEAKWKLEVAIRNKRFTPLKEQP